MKQTPPKREAGSATSDRDARRAEALRANLVRRKRSSLKSIVETAPDGENPGGDA